MSDGLSGPVGLELQGTLGLTGLNLFTYMQGYGSTAGQVVQNASVAVHSGMAETIAIVWADSPLSENVGGGSAYGAKAAGSPSGWNAITGTSGILTANNMYALAARRHMDTYGTNGEQLGAIAVAQMAQPPVAVLGWAQAHPGRTGERNDNFGLISGAAQSGPAAFKMARVALDEIDVVELYACYTFTALTTLEDYGFLRQRRGRGLRFPARHPGTERFPQGKHRRRPATTGSLSPATAASSTTTQPSSSEPSRRLPWLFSRLSATHPPRPSSMRPNVGHSSLSLTGPPGSTTMHEPTFPRS